MGAMTIQQAFELAAQNYRAGRLAEAEQICRQTLTQQPDHADSLNLLGVIASQIGQYDAAVDLFCKAVALKPDRPTYHSNLGNALMKVGQIDQAIAAHRTSIGLNSGYAGGHYNLGNALRSQGQLDQAIAAYRTAIQLDPQFAGAHNNMGAALRDLGHLKPAMAAYRTAIQLDPQFAGAHNNLATALKDLGQVEDAVAAYRTAIRLDPRLADAHNNLGTVLKDAGELDPAIAAFRTAIKLNAHFAVAHSNLIMRLHYHPGVDASAIAEEQRRWNQRHAEPLKHLIEPHSNDRCVDRRLRVGYVSPGFCRHPVGRFMLPLLEHHDHAAVEIFCYADGLRSDEMTEQLRRHADQWRKTRGLSDQQVAQMMRQDRIDILVDLTMHAAEHRLLVFARKPAPVQVTWLSYPGSTGMEAIDYRLTDPQLDPPGFNDACYSEKSVYLPHTFWCYSPPTDAPEVNELPALLTGRITFGCLNTFAKVNEMMLSAWCRLLQQLPSARLLLHALEGSHRQKVRDQLAGNGIDPARLEFVGYAPPSKYFQCYHQIDIALDTFPFCGGTTSCDALWMGVPVVSLVGKTTVSRGGLTILTNVGLAELAAYTADDYVKIAADLANDLPRLAALRTGLRQHMAQSPLMDATRFARDIEAAFRDMWRRWCAG
jgi:predicted O-linked N-acetylglucosamine transferase (SPINDLY family)